MVQLVLGSLASLLVLVIAAIRQPQTARCPDGWSVNDGIRRTGEFSCGAPLPRGCGEGTGQRCPRVPEVRGRIYCTGGAIPIVVDHRTVGCQHRH